MSLFEDEQYQYRETYFLLFDKANLPSTETLQTALKTLGPRYETIDVKRNDSGFESLTVRSPYDFSAMDITYVEGDEVTQQIAELMDDLRTTTLGPDDYARVARLEEANARFDIFHFEQADTASENDEFLDPGGLLIVIDKIAELCQGVGIDPSSNSLI